MDALWYLFAGFFVTWLIIGLYLFSLRRQIEALRSEIAALRGERSGVETTPSTGTHSVQDVSAEV